MNCAIKMQRPQEDPDYSVLVPLANPATQKALLRLAAWIARGAGERPLVTALRIMLAPPHMSLEAAQAFIVERADQIMPALNSARAEAEAMGLPCEPLVRAAHNVGEGLLQAAAELRPDLLLLGWRGRISGPAALGAAVEAVVREAPCHVAVLRHRRLGQTISRVLVAMGRGRHTVLGTVLAANIAASLGCPFTILRVAAPDADVAEEQRDLDQKLRRIDAATRIEMRPHLRPVVKISASVCDAVLEEARQGSYDLVIVGATDEYGDPKRLFGELPDKIAERAPCSVLMTRWHEGRPLRVLRRLLGVFR